MRTLRVYVSDSVTRDRVEKVCEKLAGTPAKSSRVWCIQHENLTQAQGYAINDLLQEGRRITDINFEAVQYRVQKNREAYHAMKGQIEEAKRQIHARRD